MRIGLLNQVQSYLEVSRSIGPKSNGVGSSLFRLAGKYKREPSESGKVAILSVSPEET